MGKVMQDKCVIFAGGYINTESVYVPQDAFLICADRGYLAAKKLGMKPFLVIGDFDSLGYVPCTEGVSIYPSEKDDTDTLLAVKEALEAGAKEICIYGALGGRLDHTLANIQTLAYITENGAVGTLVSDENIVTMQAGGTKKRYKRREEFYFSVLSYTEKCTGVCISGTEYTLTEGEL
ncbi:MAG: thiamine diphosphokinase, partial [Ruminococcus sp.]